MKDRVLVGFIAGALAAVGTAVANSIFYSIGFTDFRFFEWTSRLFFGYMAATTTDTIVAQITHIIWDGLMGVLFIKLIPAINSKHLPYKGMLFAIALFLVFRGIVVLFNVVPLNTFTPASFLSNIILSIIWGLVAALVIKRLIHREHA